MTDEELFNKLEPDGCWHKDITTKEKCSCGECTMFFNPSDINPDFSIWEGFGWMWERGIEKDWWIDFMRKNTQYCPGLIWHTHAQKFKDIIHPTRFRDALKEYLKEEKDE